MFVSKSLLSCKKEFKQWNKKCSDAIVEAKCNVGEVNNVFPESLPRVLILLPSYVKCFIK